MSSTNAAVPAAPRETLIWQGADDRGSRLLLALYNADGALSIGGQDLGAAVAVFHPDAREYEWIWTIPAAEIPRASRILGGSADDDIIEVLQQWASENPFHDPGQFLKDAGLHLAFWSRVGD